MNTLEVGFDRYYLRDELTPEDLICLLDLLRDARHGADGRLLDVKVGFAHPQPPQPEQPEQPHVYLKGTSLDDRENASLPPQMKVIEY